MSYKPGSLVSWSIGISWWALNFSSPFVVLKYTASGVLGLWLCSIVLWFLDWSLLESQAKNKEAMYSHGFTNTFIYGTTIFNYFVHFASLEILRWMFMKDIDIWDVTWQTPFLVAITSLISDAAFTPVHKYILHQWWPENHLLHHLCAHATAGCVYVADPLDILVFEVGSIAVGVVGFSIGVLHNPVVMFWTFVFLYTYFFMNHDENLHRPHWMHHRYTSGQYPFIVTWRDLNANDTLKKLARIKD